MNDKPVFLYGTGRCASTYFQRLITLKTNAWIWGEHDGMLTPLLRSYQTAKDSRNIQQFIFADAHESSEKQFIKIMATESKMLSWLNNFTADDLKASTAGYIRQLLGSKLPEGWDQWGFKEIRYGNKNNMVPELLFDVFPLSRAGFTFRNPEDTIDSMIRNWSEQFEAIKEDPEAMRRAVGDSAVLWRNIMDYFLKLKDAERLDVVFLTIDSLLDENSLFDKLKLTQRPDSAQFSVGETNIGMKVKTPLYNEIFQQAYNPYREELDVYYRRAMVYAEK